MNQPRINSKAQNQELECEVYVPGCQIPYEAYRVHLARYVLASEFVKDAHVLDIATGTGYGASYLIRKGARSVVGADRSEEAVRIAKSAYQKPGLSFQVADAAALPFTDCSFDVVASMGTIDHLVYPLQFVAECHRVLKDGGYFVCSVFNKQIVRPLLIRHSVDQFHKVEFTPPELCQLAGRYFQVVRVVGQTGSSTIRARSIRILDYLLRERLRLPFDRFADFAKGIGRRFGLFSYSRPIIYSEDRVDSNLDAGEQWAEITSSSMASHFLNFLVVGQKGGEQRALPPVNRPPSHA